jgi:ABC-type sulfate transport system permease component
MGYATAGSEAQVNEYLVLRLQQQTDLPISMPRSSAAFATLQIVVANFLFQSGMSLHIICTYCSSAIVVANILLGSSHRREL